MPMHPLGVRGVATRDRGLDLFSRHPQQVQRQHHRDVDGSIGQASARQPTCSTRNALSGQQTGARKPPNKRDLGDGFRAVSP